MGDLISRDRLLRDPYFQEDRYPETPLMRMAIREQPAVDAVKVVRCKNCKHSKPPALLTQKYGEKGTLTCHNWHSPCNKRNTNQDDYCSYGERKTKDAE